MNPIYASCIGHTQVSFNSKLKIGSKVEAFVRAFQFLLFFFVEDALKIVEIWLNFEITFSTYDFIICLILISVQERGFFMTSLFLYIQIIGTCN